MLTGIVWHRMKKSWWKDRHDSPVFGWQLEDIRRSVLKAIEDPASIPYLPVLEGNLPSPGDERPILLACCDEGYFYKFARQLAISSAAESQGTRIHLHIYDPGPLCLADAEFLESRLAGTLTVSHEGAARNPYGHHAPYFYAAGRFAVGAVAADISDAPMMIVDADGIVRHSLETEFAALAASDAGLIRRGQRAKPWRKVLASAVFINRTAAGRRFLHDLSAAIHLALQKTPRYHVDQTAISFLLDAYAAARLPLEMADLGMTWSDHEFSPLSAIWSAKGGRKRQFQSISLQQARNTILGKPARSGESG